MHLEVEGIAWLFRSHYGRQLVTGFQRLPIRLRDHVPAEPVRRADEDDLHRAALEADIRGRAALANVLNEDTLVDGHPEVLGEVSADARDVDPEARARLFRP